MKRLFKKAPPLKVQIAEYLEWCEFIKRMTRSTMVTKRKALDRFMAVNPALKDLTKLTNQEFDVWRASLAKEGKAGKTINSYADHVIGALKFLSERKRMPIAINLKMIERAEEETKDALYFTAEEIDQIKAECQGLRQQIFISLIWDSGLRISEVQHLMVENLRGCNITVKQGKGRKDRPTFMRQETRDMLDEWLKRNDITEGYVFPSPRRFKKPLDVCQIRESINLPIRRAGLQGSAHTIRHGFVTRLIDGGAPLETTQTLLGHEDPRTTLHYYHRSVSKLAKHYAEATA